MTPMRRVPRFEDAFAETLVTNEVKLPDRSALEAWSSFDLNFIANQFKQMVEAENAQNTQKQILLQLQKMAGEEGRPLADLHREQRVHERPPLSAPAQPPRHRQVGSHRLRSRPSLTTTGRSEQPQARRSLRS